MQYGGIVGDALDGLLAITPLLAKADTAAQTATDGSEKDLRSAPGAVAFALIPALCTAAYTITVRVYGRNKSADSWTLIGTFTQVTNAAQAIQLMNCPTPYRRYKAQYDTTGAYGGGVQTAFTVAVVGTNSKFGPITQVA
jgi:hypothetical protein